MTRLAAPTTSGPMPSPGSSSMSNESRIFLLKLRPRSQPFPAARTQSHRQQLLGPSFVHDVLLGPQRARQHPQEPLAELLHGRRAQDEQQVLERHLLFRAHPSSEAPDGEAELVVYRLQVLRERQVGPADDGRGERLREKLPEP